MEEAAESDYVVIIDGGKISAEGTPLQLKKDGGKVYIDGCDIDNNSEITKTKLGVVFQSSVLDKALTVRDNLQCRAALYGIKGKQFESKLSFLASI